MSAVEEVVWYPPGGADPITFGMRSGDYLIKAISGLADTQSDPLTVKAPSQAGETAVDVLVEPRRVSLSALIVASGAESAELRARLASALVVQPVRPGEDVVLGTLRVIRAGAYQALELPALPRRSPGDTIDTGGMGLFGVEWLCPYPYWMETADSFALLESEGGFEFEVELPLEMQTNNIEIEIDNAGDVDAPILARLYGDATTVRLLNVTTGEEIEVADQVEADEYVEISTAFGQKRIELVTISTGARVSIFDRLNLAKADFWQLRPGVNVIRFEADINVSGKATVHWRQRFGGV